MSDVEADLLIALRKLAKADATAHDFTLAYDSLEILVDYVGGSSSRLTLSARYDAVARTSNGLVRAIRPMSITLRAEDASDREAKAEGISREHQTGDATFDDAIYVDSPTADAAILDAVLSERVKSAAMELVALGFESIVIDGDDRRVTALVSAFGKMRDVTDAPGRVTRAISAAAAA